MDPISVSVSILGLLGAASKVSEVLTSFTGNFKDAPRLAQCVITEVDDVKVCLQRLQGIFVPEIANRTSRKAMVMVDQLRVVLSHCVITFSELEAVVETLSFRRSRSIGNRLRWVTKESTISKLLQRLQASKLSLNLVLTTLTCVDVEEAQQSIDALTGLVHDVLATNQDICRRLEQTDHQLKHQSAPSALETLDCMGDTPKPETDRNTWSSDVTRVARRASEYDSSFEQDLRQSRVYTRISRNIERSDPDMLSLPSSTRRSIGYSFLSGMSLADVSDISLISLPIPIQSLSNRQRYQGPIVTSLPSKYFLNGSDHVTRSTGKILLLGISNAGKSTILKHLQQVQGIKPTRVEIEEARHVILTGLINTFRLGLLQSIRIDFIGNVDAAIHLLTHASNVLKDKAQLLREEHLAQVLEIIRELWAMEETRWAINSGLWTQKLSNIPHIMDNLDRILWEDSFISNLCVHIQTAGVYRSKVTVDPFDFKICDVGGSRSARKKWIHCLKDKLDYVIYVVDLAGYSHTMQEDHDTASESLRVFESVVNSPPVQNLPIFLLLNKADVFENMIHHQPISEFFPDYEGATDYHKACGFFADRFAGLDRRSPGRLHCYVTNCLDTIDFQNAWRQVHEKMVHTLLKY
ncbi:MAG: hypothetical protein Q9197_000525 [Variospora fuerteventurae]